LAAVLSCGAVAIICAALIALLWINTERAIRDQAEDTRGRVEAALTAQATTLGELVQQELASIDQSLSVLQAAWNDNPNTFVLTDWRAKMPALTAVSEDVFVANDKRVIIQDINPAAVGQGVGSAYARNANGSLERIQIKDPGAQDSSMLVGELGSAGVVRQQSIYMIRPLQKTPGWIVGAAYRSSVLTRVFATAGLGPGGLAAMIDTRHGGVQAVAGTAALQPRIWVGDSAMYKAMLDRPDGGTWIGRTPIDGADRIVAFRRVPGRDLIVLVGVTTTQAMAPATNWAVAAQALATLATLLVLAIGATVLWEVWHWRSTRRRRRALAGAGALTESLQKDLATLRSQAAVDAAQVRAVLAGISEGIAMFDGEQNLAGWNARFAALSGVAEGSLQVGLPLEEVLRQQALAGRFGMSETSDTEIARLVAALRPESGPGQIAATGTDGTAMVLRARATTDGRLVLLSQAAEAMPAGAATVKDAAAAPVA
jgi:PAS domain-containing protein